MRLLRFKSPWYYWHTGRRRVALISLLISVLVMAGLAALSSGLSLWALAPALVLDSLGVGLLLVYLFVIRGYLPDLAIDALDAFVSMEILLPLLLGVVITRCVTWGVARFLGNTAGEVLRHPVSPVV